MARASIAVPTYNGAETISESLNCIRSQSFEDFEVVICDNASTDGTSEICAEFARQDKRFRHVRSNINVPVMENFRKALSLGEADYFMWRADDDLTDENHLEATVKALDREREARLAVTPVHRINTSTGREADYPLPVSEGADRLSRAKATLLGCHPSWFYGLWRRDAVVEDMAVLRDYPYAWAADHLTTMRAMINGQVAFAPEATFTQRIMREGSYHLQPAERLAARRKYVEIARRIIAETDYSAKEKIVLKKALEQHANKRVAPWFRMYKRALRERIRAIFSPA
ncbi:glycosyltransferase [Ensifer sp. IC4062]|nr:glycosyltransferase [Ensifer sp. IC4062]